MDDRVHRRPHQPRGQQSQQGDRCRLARCVDRVPRIAGQDIMRWRGGERHRCGGAFGPECVQHRDGAVAEVGHGQVGVPIAVEVAHRNRRRIDSNRYRGRRGGSEVPRSIALQDRDGVVVEVGYGQVERSIAVEVARRNETRIDSNCNWGSRCGGEAPRPIAQQDRHRAGGVVAKWVVPATVRHRQVENPIAVEVPHRYGVRTVSNRECRSGGEAPRSIAQQDRHRTGR